MPRVETIAGFEPIHRESGKTIELTMQRLHVTGRILPIGARLMVVHSFRSSERKPVEVIYTFGLPRDASVRRFRIVGEGFSVRSELKPAKEARQAYEEGVEQGSLSALVEGYRDGLVSLNTGNIRPGEEVKVVVEVLCGVELRDDGLRFRFPFTLAPAYHSKALMTPIDTGVGEIELPGDEFGDLILPQFASDASALHEIGFDLNASMPQAIAEVSSPSHGIRVCPNSARSFRVSLAGGGDAPNRDLVLDAKAVDGIDGVLSGKDQQGRGRFSVVISSKSFGQPSRSPRRIIFVLDRSGSMAGTSMTQARNAVKACLGVLTEHDRFGIVAFDNRNAIFQPKMMLGSRMSRLFEKSSTVPDGWLFPATSDVRRQAAHFLDQIDARGGTELAAAVGKASEILGEGEAEIVVITDGQVFGTEDILANARKTGIRLHCLGIGEASSDRFLTLLARDTGGVSRFVTPRERVDREALELFSSISSPVAKGLIAEIKGMSGGKLNVLPPDTVFEGLASTAMGEAEPSAKGELGLTWQSDGRHEASQIAVEIGESSQGETIRLLEGARLITDLESRETADAGSIAARRTAIERVRRRLESLSSEYGLASREMSLVAVVERPGDRPGEIPETTVVAVGMPGDTPFHAYFGRSGRVTMGGALDTGRFADAMKRECRTLGRTHDTGCFEDIMPTAVARPSRPAKSWSIGGFGGLPKATARPKPDSDPFARLLRLVTEVEPDGGMPGRSLEERLYRSAHALLCLLEDGHSPTAGPLRSHAERLVAFLERHLAEHGEISLLVEASRDGTSLGGNWLEVEPDSRVWQSITEALGSRKGQAAGAVR